jgi:hypothetical protein
MDISKFTRTLLMGLVASVPFNHALAASGEALSSVPAPYLSDDELPPRTAPLIELGPKFLSTGNIAPGFKTWTGAVWTPSLWVYGNYRTAYQVYDDTSRNNQQVREWANRLDLFANLQLSGTERILLGLTPLHDRKTGEFSGKVYAPERETINAIGTDIDTFFFEGDIAELFPNWDYNDSTPNDIGFTVGRQNVVFMDGFLVNDNMDGIGLSKNNIRFTGNTNIINWRSSLFVGLDGVNRNNNAEDSESTLVGWFNQIDTIKSTYNFDLVYVDGSDAGDLINLGLDATQRSGKLNSTFRVAFSSAVGEETSESSDGTILFSELSWVPAHTHDNAYFNSFFTFDDFTSAARGALTGGPLGRTGILFASPGLGSAPAPISNSAREAAGLAWGYQLFSEDLRKQFVFEFGARIEEESSQRDEYGIGMRYQHAIGQRTFGQIDVFATSLEGSKDIDHGLRLEIQFKL